MATPVLRSGERDGKQRKKVTKLLLNLSKPKRIFFSFQLPWSFLWPQPEKDRNARVYLFSPPSLPFVNMSHHEVDCSSRLRLSTWSRLQLFLFFSFLRRVFFFPVRWRRPMAPIVFLCFPTDGVFPFFVYRNNFFLISISISMRRFLASHNSNPPSEVLHPHCRSLREFFL